MGQQTSINVQAVKGGSEQHNRREKTLDYVRPELSHLNQYWESDTQANRLATIKALYQSKTGQKMQAKATPIREGVVVISDTTTMADLHRLADAYRTRLGVDVFQIAIHKDEGYQNSKEWKPNLHAHLVFDWTDHETGKSIKLNRQKMAEMQTITAEVLRMQRGKSSEKKHLTAQQYKNQVESERAAQLKAEMETLRTEKKEIKLNNLKAAAVNAGTNVIDSVGSLFKSGKVKQQEKEIESLKTALLDAKAKLINKDGLIRGIKAERDSAVKSAQMAQQREADKLQAVTDLFPCMENAEENINELRSIGIKDNDIRRLMMGEKMYYSGELKDPQRNEKASVKNVKIEIAPSRDGGNFVWLNDSRVQRFFRDLWCTMEDYLGWGRGM